jgi:hypothetical protein
LQVNNGQQPICSCGVHALAGTASQGVAASCDIISCTSCRPLCRNSIAAWSS